MMRFVGFFYILFILTELYLSGVAVGEKSFKSIQIFQIFILFV